jgi:cephalosporin-C deacetylase
MRLTLLKSFVTFIALLCLCSRALSQSAPAPLVKVIVSLDHNDWTYKLNEEASFAVQVLKYGTPINDVHVDYEAGPEEFPDTNEKGIILKDGKLELSGTMKVPGFYRVKVSAFVDGNRYDGLATAGFEPDQIQPTVKNPADFDAFWTNAINEARKVDLDPRLTLLPERCTSLADVYHVSFQNESAGSRIYGILAVPKKAGKYPALLRVPGAGVRPYAGDAKSAGIGIISLEIGIHGIPVNLDPEVYNSLANGALFSYSSIRLNDRDAFYYKRVYLGCVRAVDFLFSLPEFNGSDIAVTGGSQGGSLTIVTAALDKRIKALAPMYPALCDNTGYLSHRAGGWPHYFKTNEPKPGEVETLGYYDVVNFARRISVPGFYSSGYNDETCAPTSVFSAYNVITAPKELDIFLDTGHWTYPEEDQKVTSWLIKRLTAK